MKSIDKRIKSELVIEKSRFITNLFPINSDKDVKRLLTEIKKEYPGATHYCYAYIILPFKRFNDNGEPSGTAGAPILNVLESKKIDHVLAIVIRYFGGIKLGTGGLVRAYTKSVTNAFLKANIVSLEKGTIIEIEFTYSNQKQIEHYLKKYKVIEKNYDELCKYKIIVPEKETVFLTTTLDNYSNNIKILENVLITKKDD